MGKSYKLRLVAAFAGVGIGAAALTALLVNAAFNSRFDVYVQQQRQVHEQQMQAALADSYVRMGGWNTTDLQGLAPLALMDGGTLRLLGTDGQEVWDASTGPGSRLAQMQHSMTDGATLGPPDEVQVVVNGSPVGTAVIRFPVSGLLPEDEAFRASVNRLLLIGGLAAALFALGAGIVLARRAVRPAVALTEVAKAVAAGDRSLRVTPDATEEFGAMARAFNQMADTVAEEDELRRTFAADVAHELRTPLAVLLSQVEGMQDGVIPADPQALSSLHEETLRIGRLVADLETLASADAAGFTLRAVPTELEELLAGVAREFQGLADARNVRIDTHLVPARVVVDASRIRQVVANLLSNSVKFTPSGGSIALSLEAEGKEAVVVVADTGPGIPENELPHVFERFFRGRHVRAGGSGIGLSVARELAVAHGGALSVTSRAGQGSRFELRIPLAPGGIGGPDASEVADVAASHGSHA